MATILNLNNSGEKRIRVLVAPLDWGLGHATRCIPIIRQLIILDCEVIIASSGAQKTLLEQEFPVLRFLELPGYGLKYAKKRWSTSLKIFLQIPKILTAIKRENRWLRFFLERERLDLLISDNRYGLYSKGLYSILITHQLCIQIPLRPALLRGVLEEKLRRLHYRYIDRFSRCWIPDLESGKTLAGSLSHPEQLPSATSRYIGILSRFRGDGKRSSGEAENVGETGRKSGRKQGDGIVFLLSGPEPQRTLLEKRVVHALKTYQGRSVIVRGLPVRDRGGVSSVVPSLSVEGAGVTVYSHLPAAELRAVIEHAGLVICRSGYSTIMDLVTLGKKAVLIPTPGQTEQEYLGDRLAGMHLFMCVRQDNFSLPDVLAEAGRFPFTGFDTGREGILDEEISEVLKNVSPEKPG